MVPGPESVNPAPGLSPGLADRLTDWLTDWPPGCPPCLLSLSLLCWKIITTTTRRKPHWYADVSPKCLRALTPPLALHLDFFTSPPPLYLPFFSSLAPSQLDSLCFFVFQFARVFFNPSLRDFFPRIPIFFFFSPLSFLPLVLKDWELSSCDSSSSSPVLCLFVCVCVHLLSSAGKCEASPLLSQSV